MIVKRVLLMMIISVYLGEVLIIETGPVSVVEKVEIGFKLNHDPGVSTGICSLHPAKHYS